MVRHFAAVADAVAIPIVIQDYPPVSGFAMEPWLLVRIAREVAAANTIKLEDPPTPFKTSRIREAAQGMDIAIFGGAIPGQPWASTLESYHAHPFKKRFSRRLTEQAKAAWSASN